MALNPTNSQGTKVYVAATANALTSTATAADVATAIAAGKQIGCIQDLGDIGSTRNVQEYSCISNDESTKVLGSIKPGNVNISLLFNATDTEGQAALRTMFNNNEARTIIVEFNDDAGTNPTYIYFEGGISDNKYVVQKDNAVMYDTTMEFLSTPTIILAS